MEESYSHPDIPEILSIFGNNTCCDCGTSNPKYTSLNNGVFLCQKCANIHQKFGPSISQILSLQTDKFTEDQLVYLTKGGNQKLKINLASFDIFPDSNLIIVYASKAADYYRKYLENEVNKACLMDYIPKEIIKPDINEAKQLIDKKYENIDLRSDNQSNNSGFFGYMGSMTQNMGKNIGQMKIGEKLYNAGGVVVDYAKISGSYIADKTKQAYNSQFVQNVTKKAGDGINYAINKAKTYLGNDENNDNDINNVFIPNPSFGFEVEDGSSNNNINNNI